MRRSGGPSIEVATRRAVLIAAIAALAPEAAVAASGDPVQIADPPPGKALIIFYRKWEYVDWANSYIVREGKVDLGLLSPGSYFIATVDPGLHTYTVHAERHSDMQIRVDPGEIYYVRFELDMGVILYQPTLTPSEQWQFDEVSAKLKLSQPLATGNVANGADPPVR